MRETFIRGGALAVAAAALGQWWQLIDRGLHIVRMYCKFGDFPVTAGTTSLLFFLVASAVCIALGLSVSMLARERRAWPSRVARLGTTALAIGAVIWPLTVASPLVSLVER